MTPRHPRAVVPGGPRPTSKPPNDEHRRVVLGIAAQIAAALIKGLEPPQRVARTAVDVAEKIVDEYERRHA